jgi:hypothetical protein
MPATDGQTHNCRRSIEHGKRVGQRGPRPAQASDGRIEIAPPETGLHNRGFRFGYFLTACVGHKPRSQSSPAVCRAPVRRPGQMPFLNVTPD